MRSPSVDAGRVLVTVKKLIESKVRSLALVSMLEECQGSTFVRFAPHT